MPRVGAAPGDALQGGGPEDHGPLAAGPQEGRALSAEDLPHAQRLYTPQGGPVTGKDKSRFIKNSTALSEQIMQ